MISQLEAGRESYRRRAWGEAFQSLVLADQVTPLSGEDLELLATAAYLTGSIADFHRALDRAHHAFVRAGDRARAARCAFWLALTLLLGGDAAQANGWLARARRLLEGHDCVEHGYLLLPAIEQYLAEGNAEAAGVAASTAAALGDRLGDADLGACARHLQGRALLQLGKLQAGLALLDEAMLAVVQGELSPILTGLMYCSVIEACQQAFASSRAREWTHAMSHWCEQQPELVAFTGTCLVNRAEIMQFHGAWGDALAEACRACRRSAEGAERPPPAAAFYRQAEIHRLRGDFAAAEQAYRDASQRGLEPYPGLALLRMAQGRSDAACAAIRRVLDQATDPLQRAKLLPAHIEILLAAGDAEIAGSACLELQTIAETFGTDTLRALAAQAQGALALDERDPQKALRLLRRAFELWERVEAPYEAARVRLLIGAACRTVGDDEAGGLELDAARAVFERLGAAPELARLDAVDRQAWPGSQAAGSHLHGLTARELQVLRLVASGKTNKAIARQLCVSARTIDRHVSNIFTKLDVPSRAAATAYAYDHKLL